MVDKNNVGYEVDSSLLGEKLIFPSSKREARNRFLKAAMSEKLCFFDKDNQQISGIPTQRLINLYSKWAHGGFGMILTGNLMVDINHPECAGNTIIEKVLDSKERRDAFKKLADTMKSGGALAIAQLSHAGRMTSITINEHPFSASDVQFKGKKNGQGFGVPIPLTEEQIRTEVIARFVYTAKFCQEAGFDGVEIHGAHGYLLSQFMSPTTNKRTDQYGGSVYNRARLILEIYEAIRTEIPAETGFVVGIKMNSVEFQDQGLENEDALIMCKEFEKVGFDFIELSGGTIEKRAFHHEKESTRKREAYFIEFANKIKPALTKTIVYLTGGFRSVSGMINAIKDNVTDGIGMARPSAAEPDLPNKILTKNIQKAVFNPFENDHHLSLMAAQSQLWQGGEISYEETKNDLCFGIMNLSDPTVAETYTNDLLKFETDLVELAATGSPIIDVFEYKIKAGA